VEGGLMARIVFDLDGTLIDSAPDIRAVANAVLAAEGAAPLSLEETRAFVGRGAPVFVERMRAARGLPEAAEARMLTAFIARYESAVDMTAPYPSAVAALDALAAEGHALGICTNKPYRPCRAVLSHLGLIDRFAAIVGGDSLSVKKPDPAPLAAAFAALGEGPRVYVGDSEIDADCARRAGAPFLLFTEGYRQTPVAELPHFAAFSDFAELPALVRAALAAED
jgi:phosphoglycolate phosphatase